MFSLHNQTNWLKKYVISTTDIRILYLGIALRLLLLQFLSPGHHLLVMMILQAPGIDRSGRPVLRPQPGVRAVEHGGVERTRRRQVGTRTAAADTGDRRFVKVSVQQKSR